ncbi:MAG: hypothetical protein WBW33_16870 [Bryobacteraceae bacterium]
MKGQITCKRGEELEIRNQLVRTPATFAYIEYENAQKRIHEVFGQWKAPANFKIEFFVVRVRVGWAYVG